MTKNYVCLVPLYITLGHCVTKVFKEICPYVVCFFAFKFVLEVKFVRMLFAFEFVLEYKFVRMLFAFEFVLEDKFVHMLWSLSRDV